MSSVSTPQPSAPQPSEQAASSNLTQRLVTSALVLPVVLIVTWLGGFPFALLGGAMALVGLIEFYLLASGRYSQGSTIIGVPLFIAIVAGFYLQQDAIWLIALIVGTAATLILETLRHPNDFRRSLIQTGMTLFGVFYLAFPTGFLIATRAIPGNGLYWLLWVFALTWGTDTMAYIGGRLWGKRKLAPSISPKKTVEGAIVGIFGGWTPALIILGLNGLISPATLLITAAAPFVAIAGDLIESYMKRWFGAKDSHIRGLDILPGHGGVLDRVDSLVFVTTFVYFGMRLLGVI